LANLLTARSLRTILTVLQNISVWSSLNTVAMNY